MNTTNEALMLIVHEQRAHELRAEATAHRMSRWHRVRRGHRKPRDQRETSEVRVQPRAA